MPLPSLRPSPARPSSPWIRWLARVLLGLGLAAGSAEVAFIFGNQGWEVLAGCALAAVVGLAVAGHAEWHDRRRRLVRKACSALSLPAAWSVKFDRRLPGGWVAPLAVIRDDGMRFVVDIRGFQTATWASARRKGQVLPTLVDAKDRPVWPDPVPALVAAGIAASAAPVLWLPRAAGSGTFRHPDTNVVVVAGDARDLKLALQSARRVGAHAGEVDQQELHDR